MSTVPARDDRQASVNGQLDPGPTLYVRTAPLRSMLIQFVESWARERPNGCHLSAAASARHGVTVTEARVRFVGAIDYLVSETGLQRSTIEHIKSGTRQTALLATADALVSALGHPEAFHDGTLEVLRRSGSGFRPAD